MPALIRQKLKLIAAKGFKIAESGGQRDQGGGIVGGRFPGC